MHTEPRHHAGRRQRDIGMVAEILAAMDVRDMHLEDRKIAGLERVENGDRGVGIGAGIYDEAGDGRTRLVNPVDELVLSIALAPVEREVELAGDGAATRLDIRERRPALDLRLPQSQQIEIGTVEDQNLGPHRRSCRRRRRARPGAAGNCPNGARESTSATAIARPGAGYPAMAKLSARASAQ